jgi:hypothetical protein
VPDPGAGATAAGTGIEPVVGEIPPPQAQSPAIKASVIAARISLLIVKVTPLLLLVVLTACQGTAPYATTIGVLQPGSTLTVHAAGGNVNAYQPIEGQPGDRFTLAPTALPKGTPPPVPHIRPVGNGIVVDAPGPLANLLVRVPKGVNLVVDSQKGDVNVTDISGNAKISAKAGNVTVMLSGYAQASDVEGSISVTMGSTDWPGTLRFTTQHGDVEVSVNEHAAFNVRLHTDNGTLFTDFDLRGTSQGSAETIDAPVNGGGSRSIDISTSFGSIRLLRLHPQA